jgi:hypothetical protein
MKGKEVAKILIHLDFYTTGEYSNVDPIIKSISYVKRPKSIKMQQLIEDCLKIGRIYNEAYWEVKKMKDISMLEVHDRLAGMSSKKEYRQWKLYKN